MLLLSAYLLVGAATALAGACDEGLTPVDNWALQYRARDGRCEGFYAAEVSSGGALEMVGLTHGPFSYPLEEGVVISLGCPLLAENSAHIQAVGIPLKMYYRMDAEVTSDGSIAWTLDDLVFPQGISAADVGVLAWLKDDENERSAKVYVPVLASMGGSIGGSDVDVAPLIHLVVRPSVDVEDVQWRIAPHGDDGCEEMGEWTLDDRPSYLAGRPIAIQLEASDPQVVCVEIAARNQVTGSWLKRDVLLLVSAATDDE